ncbi:hypothetical protein [Campylobacter iguaniorum]|uniref:hypothetical protein n=1 Tax=Campylobacter iguaniorum TaxID=1244531 RepID=UPI0007C90D5B|nr:hypothetical protein [Campylobacter iguaniorum]
MSYNAFSKIDMANSIKQYYNVFDQINSKVFDNSKQIYSSSDEFNQADDISDKLSMLGIGFFANKLDFSIFALFKSISLVKFLTNYMLAGLL